MRAVVLREYGPPDNLEWTEVPTPAPRAGEVLLRVGAVSVDLFQMEFRSGRALQIPLPRIMGNGPSGTVAELGGGVEGLAVGQRVVVSNNVSCGNCRYCRVGRETLCAGLNNHRSGMIGAHRDGGYAEFVAVPARNCVPLPDTVTFEQACLVPNTIAPVVKACSGRAGIRPAESVLIVGAGGGMGVHAVQAARACGGRVIAAIRSMHTADAVREVGADAVLSTNQRDWREQVRQLTEGWGADVVLDFVATRETLADSLSVLAPAGRLVIMGYFPRGGVLETPTWVFTEERTVTGNRSAGRQDVADTVALIRDGRITPMVPRVFPLADAVAAHRAFEAGEIVGRAVLMP
ncbi:MAG: alcohol dehydrogenase catalytic domain-containing protein [Burkholderiales bacterium]